MVVKVPGYPEAHGLKPDLAWMWELVCMEVMEGGLKPDLGYNSVGISGAILSKDLVLEFLAVIFNNQCCIPVTNHAVDGVLLCAKHNLPFLQVVQVQHTAPVAWCLARCSL